MICYKSGYLCHTQYQLTFHLSLIVKTTVIMGTATAVIRRISLSSQLLQDVVSDQGRKRLVLLSELSLIHY